MPRHERLDFKDAIHYVSLRGRNDADIFLDAGSIRQFSVNARGGAPRALKFELLLAASCEECGAVLHAYCLQPNAGTLVLRTAGTPLRVFMQRLCGGYSRYLHSAGFAERRSVFCGRYDSKVVAPQYLPHAVRRAHRSPIVNGLCRRRVDYPFSSERSYTGEAVSLALSMVEMKSALEHRGLFGLRGYREFMDQEETHYVANLLSKGSPLDSRIVGDKVFVQRARYLAATSSKSPTRAQLVDAVARFLNGSPADIVSATHVGVLGRALVAWYGQRMGAATLTEMGCWFSITGAALGQAIRNHRGATPDLFGLNGLPGLEADPDEQDQY